MKSSLISKICVIIGGFLCYMIADGCTFSIGIIYRAFLDVFHQSKAATAVLPGLIYGLPQISGPIVSPLVNIIGSSYAAIIGGLILVFSFFVSQFVVSLQIMYITMGFLASIGLELTYVSGIMAVTKEFSGQNYLGLALGITVSGSGIGVFLFNPLISHLMDAYTWKGALIIDSGLFLHIIIAGFIFKLSSVFKKRPIDDHPSGVEKEKPSITVELVNPTEVIIRENIHRNSVKSLSTSNIDNEDNQSNADNPRFSTNNDRRSSIALSMTQTKHCEPFRNPVVTRLKSNSLDKRINSADGTPNIPVDERSASFVKRLSLFGSENFRASLEGSKETISSKPLDNFGSMNSGNDEKELINKNNECENEKLDVKTHSSKYVQEFFNALRSLISKQIWRNSRLLYFLVISFCFAASVVITWTFSYHKYSLIEEISEFESSMLISFIGAGSCLGQIIFGYISDFIPAVTLYAIGCAIAGICTIVLIWIQTYWLLLIIHFGFGFGQGVSYALFSIILVHYTSLEFFPAGLGFFLLISGSGNLIGTTFSGYVSDVSQNYDLAYLCGGSLLIACSVFLIPLIYLWHTELNSLEN